MWGTYRAPPKERWLTILLNRLLQFECGNSSMYVPCLLNSQIFRQPGRSESVFNTTHYIGVLEGWIWRTWRSQNSLYLASPAVQIHKNSILAKECSRGLPNTNGRQPHFLMLGFCPATSKRCIRVFELDQETHPAGEASFMTTMKAWCHSWT